MLLDNGNFEHGVRDILCLPPRLFVKVTEVDQTTSTGTEKARTEALMYTSLNASSGGCFASMEDYFGTLDNTYLFTSARRLLPSGWSLGWLANDAAKPSLGASVINWIPGGSLLDVLCSRTEYTEFSVMSWTHQLLLALRWFDSCFFGHSHGHIRPENVLVARRASMLPDIMLSGFEESVYSEESDSHFSGRFEIDSHMLTVHLHKQVLH